MTGFDVTKKGFADLTGNPSNYAEWAPHAEALLKTRQEWLVTTRRYPEPEHADPDNPTRQELIDWHDWHETCDSAAGTLFLIIDNSQQELMKSIRSDPEAIWDKLVAHHQQQKPAPRFAAYDQFFNIRKEENESLSDLVSRVSKQMSSIKALRPSHFGLSRLEEELQCMALIRALPEDYRNFVSSIFLLDQISLSSLTAAFHNEENQCLL